MKNNNRKISKFNLEFPFRFFYFGNTTVQMHGKFFFVALRVVTVCGTNIFKVYIELFKLHLHYV